MLSDILSLYHVFYLSAKGPAAVEHNFVMHDNAWYNTANSITILTLVLMLHNHKQQMQVTEGLR